jgi:sterol desaturase/sphingolipid hydroxylase (fatty acid hydroxylase superfamily)
MALIAHIASLPDSIREEAFTAVRGGTMLSVATVLVTLGLELASLPTVRGVFKQRDGPSLYWQALVMNFMNHFVFGIPVYFVAVLLFCDRTEAENHWIFTTRAAAIVAVHAVIYYGIHKAFHTSPKLYIHHRFHHRFNTHVPPVAANAVSIVEYVLAYIVPFAVAALLVAPHELEFRVAIAFVSICNLLVHTPRLESLSQKLLWPIFVTTHDHLEHHRKLTTNYASPTINVDWILGQFQGLSSTKSQ